MTANGTFGPADRHGWMPVVEVEAEVTRANRDFRKTPERDMERSGSGSAATSRSIASSEAGRRSGEEFIMEFVVFATRPWPTAAVTQ